MPSIQIIEPDGIDDIADCSYTIKWADADLDDNAYIELYYGKDKDGYDWEDIVWDLEEDPDGAANEFEWDTSEVPPGAYYIAAVIYDYDDYAVAYSNGPIQLHTIYASDKITPEDGIMYDHFGISSAISGDYAIVGAYSDDDNGSSSGSAYILRRDGEEWVEHAKLTASDGEPYDEFGGSVAIKGEYAVVGSEEDDDNGSNSGSAYIFVRDGSDWFEQTKLTASDGASLDYFGDAVAIDREFVVVGALSDDDNGTNSGSAYVFIRDGSDWFEQAKLTASDGASSDNFGGAVAIYGDYLMVGAPYDDDNGSSSGSVYLFVRDGDEWTEEDKIIASDGASGDRFGCAIDMNGDYAIIGAYGDSDNGSYSGSAYIFALENGAWIELEKLTASDGDSYEYFGSSLSISGDYAVVGAKYADDRGAAYVFKYENDEWYELLRLSPIDVQERDYYGGSVSIDKNHIIVGSYADDDNGDESGSAYIYSIAPGSISAAPEVVSIDESFDLSWNFPNASSVIIDNGIGEVSSIGSLNLTIGETTTYTVTAEGCWGIFIDSVTIKVLPSIEFSASPAVINVGESTTLTWSTTNADSCIIEPDIGLVDISGSIEVFPDENTTYTITATGAGGTVTETVSVSFNAPAVEINASPTILNVGDSITLSWSSTNATSCIIEPDLGDVPLNESITLYPIENTTYTITALGPGGTATASVSVTFVAPTVNISADPIVIDLGDSSTITWATTNAFTCTIEPDIGSVDPVGSVAVSPTESTDYIITVTGPGGTTSAGITISLNYPEPGVNISADPGTIDVGGSSTLTWTSSHAMACSIEPGIGDVDLNGSITVSPTDNTTYTITATSPGGTDTASVQVTFFAPTVEINADPLTVIQGESTSLSWNSNYASSCTIEPDVGDVGLSGTVTVYPSDTKNYTITASSPGGTATASITINVLFTPVIQGTVTDYDTGEPIEGATVIVEDSEKTQSDVTESDGTYLIDNITPGDVTVSVEKDGWECSESPITITVPEGYIIPIYFLMNPVLTGATLQGIVTDGLTGLPLEGATVSVTDVDKTQSVETLSDGTYSISEISLGEVDISVSYTGYMTYSSQPTLPSNTIYDLDIALFSESAQATVFGTVTNSITLQPEPDVSISVEGTDISAMTQSDGAFTLSDVPMGEQTLKIFKEDFIDYYLIINIIDDPFQKDILHPLKEGVTYPSEIDTNAVGYVYDGLTGRPIEGAIVKVSGTGIEVTTDVDGQYSFTDLPLGQINLIAMALDHEAVSMYPTVVSGVTEELSFHLPPTARGLVTGIVTDTDTGEPIRYATIEIEGSLLSANTEADGSYRLFGVPEGNYVIKAINPEYLDEESDSIEVLSGETSFLDFTLTHRPETGSLEGLITDKDTGDPLSGVTLELEGAGIMANTDIDGYYLLNDLPAGLVNIIIDAGGYPSTSRTTPVVADEDYSTPTITIADFELDAADPDPPDSISELIYAAEGGTVETPDGRFMLVIPPNTLSGDAIVTLMNPTAAPDVAPGDDLDLDPELGMSDIKAIGQMTQVVIEPAVEGDDIPTIDDLVVISGRYFQSEVDSFNIAESSIFPYYWDGSFWTVMRTKPHEMLVDTINNTPVVSVDFSVTETGNPIVARLGTRKPIMLASVTLPGHIPNLDVAITKLFSWAGRIIEPTLEADPNVCIFDKDDLNAVSLNPDELKIPNPNALPLMIVHGWDIKNIICNNEHENPNLGLYENNVIVEDEANRYTYIIKDLVDATNGVYRPMFATYNGRSGMYSTGNDLADKYWDLNIKGLEGSGDNPGEFPYMDTFGFSMGGIITRSFQTYTQNVHNMVIVGTPNHGTYSFLSAVSALSPITEGIKDLITIWSHGTTDLLYYRDQWPILLNRNKRLQLLNMIPSCTPLGDMTLIAGTDSSLKKGILLPMEDDGTNDSVVPYWSVFCYTDNPNDGFTSLMEVNDNAKKYSYMFGFNHDNFGGNDFRISQIDGLESAITHGLSDWMVGKTVQENTGIVMFPEPYNMYVNIAECEVELQYNTFEPNQEDQSEGRLSRDFERVVLVIYAQDYLGQWYLGGDYVDSQGNILKYENIRGNSKYASQIQKISTNAEYSEDNMINNVVFEVVPLGPPPSDPNIEDKVSLEPTAPFKLP